VAIASAAGSAKTAVRRSKTSATSGRVATATARATQNMTPQPQVTARRGVRRNTYFDIVVLLSVLMFVVLAAGVGLLVLEQAAGWHL
jgi:hypothetical protein